MVSTWHWNTQLILCFLFSCWLLPPPCCKSFWWCSLQTFITWGGTSPESSYELFSRMVQMWGSHLLLLNLWFQAAFQPARLPGGLRLGCEIFAVVWSVSATSCTPGTDTLNISWQVPSSAKTKEGNVLFNSKIHVIRLQSSNLSRMKCQMFLTLSTAFKKKKKKN
jgi:hypothetical protein